MKKAEVPNLKVRVSYFPSGDLEHPGNYSVVPPVEPVTDNAPDMGKQDGDVDLRPRDHRVSRVIVSPKNQLVGSQDRVF